MLQPPAAESIYAPWGEAISPTPTRVCIDQEGRIKHIHFMSAFPEQSKELPMRFSSGNPSGNCMMVNPVEDQMEIMVRHGTDVIPALIRVTTSPIPEATR